jgi:phenylacetate-CoA ligase
MNDLQAAWSLWSVWRNLHLNSGKLEKLQRNRLNRLLCHSQQRVDFYRETLEGISAADFGQPGFLRSLPVIRKQDWRAIPPGRRIAAGMRASQMVRKTTSGSTGQPQEIWLSHWQLRLQTMLHLRSLFFCGLGWRARYLELRNQPESVAHWYHRLGLLPWTGLSLKTPPLELARQMLALRPDCVHGYSQTLRLIATELGPGKMCLKNIFATAELLTPGTRELLERNFQARVFDRYGAGETAVVAWECPAHEGLHIEADHLVVEVLDERGQPTSEVGEVVVTNLDSYAMPIIRYSLGDFARLDSTPCACGVSFPRLFDLQGRVNDLVVLKDLSKISALVVTVALDLTPGVGGYRLYQTHPGHLKILLQRGPRFIQARSESLGQVLEERTRGLLQCSLGDQPQTPSVGMAEDRVVG